MKRRVGTLYKTPIVEGDSNIVSKDEILLKRGGGDGTLSLSKRNSKGDLSNITGESDNNTDRKYTDAYFIVVYKSNVGPVTRITDVYKLDGKDGDDVLELSVTPTSPGVSYKFYIGGYIEPQMVNAYSDILDILPNANSINVASIASGSEGGAYVNQYVILHADNLRAYVSDYMITEDDTDIFYFPRYELDKIPINVEELKRLCITVKVKET